MSYRFGITKILGFILLAGVSLFSSAVSFSDYQKYSLDKILEQPKPSKELAVYKPLYYKLSIVLLSYPKPCDTELLKAAMYSAGIPAKTILDTPMTQCIRVKTLAGKTVKLYILDTFAVNLPKRVKLNTKTWLLTMYIFNTRNDGPGILVQGFLKI